MLMMLTWLFFYPIAIYYSFMAYRVFKGLLYDNGMVGGGGMGGMFGGNRGSMLGAQGGTYQPPQGGSEMRANPPNYALNTEDTEAARPRPTASSSSSGGFRAF